MLNAKAINKSKKIKINNNKKYKKQLKLKSFKINKALGKYNITSKIVKLQSVP